jgi:transcriptional regulator GlxA family with amidase domain
MFRLQPDSLVLEDADDPAFTRTVAIVVHDDVELLDFAGPGEVFQVAGGLAADRGRRALRVVTVSPGPAPVRSQGFLTIRADRTPDDPADFDLLVVPGGGTTRVLADTRFLGWFRKASARAEIVLSVCTGALVLAATGMLDGRSATTWHGFLDRLAHVAPRTRVVPGRRFVDGGAIVTTAGVSAGIDGALHVVARLLGRRVAEETARHMEYVWTPDPEHVGGYPDHPVRDDAVQRRVREAATRQDAGDIEAAIEALGEAVDREPDHAEAWLRLARARHAAGRADGARAAADRAVDLSTTRTAALHDRACLRVAAGDVDGAFDDLSRARAERRLDRDGVAVDPDLAALRRDARWDGIVSTAWSGRGD